MTDLEAARRTPLDAISPEVSACELPSSSSRLLGSPVAAMSEVVAHAGQDASMTREAMPTNDAMLEPPSRSASNVGSGVVWAPEVDEALRRLLSRRDFSDERPLPCILGVVSPSGGEGVSTVAAALAGILRADYGARVCLLNFSDPAVESAPAAEPGFLAEVASGRIPTRDLESLDFGRLTAPQWYALAHSEALAQGLAALRRSCDHIVFDVPPVLASSRSLVVLRSVDAYVLVAQHGVTSIGDVETTVEALSGLESLGSVLNRHRSRVPRRVARWLSMG